jgi:hypothetical protein
MRLDPQPSGLSSRVADTRYARTGGDNETITPLCVAAEHENPQHAPT